MRTLTRDDTEHGIEYVLKDEADVEIQVLRNDLDTALGMLAGWCIAVDENGTGWDDWDEYFKDAMYRDGPLRAMLDKKMQQIRSQG